MPATELKQEPFVKKVLITTGTAVLFVVVLLLAYYAVDVLFSLFGAILLAILFRGMANQLRRYVPMPEGASVLVSYTVVFGFLGLVTWLLAPEIADQIKELRSTLPKALETLRQWLAQYSWGELILENIPAWKQILDRFVSSGFLVRLGGIFSTTIGIAASVFAVILLSLYLASTPRVYVDGLIRLFPMPKRPRMREVVEELHATLFWWLIGKLAAMLLVGVLTTIGLAALGVPLALSLGIIAALLAFIPNFGPVLALLPAVLFALSQSPTKALYVLILYMAIQTIESYVITPLIDRETVALPPALTIFFQIFLGVLMGSLGLILASPLLAVILVLVKLLYIEDVLGGETEHISDDEDGEDDKNGDGGDDEEGSDGG